jgi:hypothetical protein
MGSPAEGCDSLPCSGNLESALSCDARMLSPLSASVLGLVVADFENFEEGKTFATFVAFDLSHDVFGFEAVSPTGWPVAIAVVGSWGNLDFEEPWSLRSADIASWVCVLCNEIDSDIRVYPQGPRKPRDLRE